MEINKYLKNKDIEITNDDFDIEKLQKDLTKGLVKEDEVNTRLADAKTEYEKTIGDLNAKIGSMQTDYDTLSTKYAEQTQTLKDKNLLNVMLEQGFKSSSFDEVSKLRTSLYGDEPDDTKAVQKVKEHFGKVYFDNPKEQAPNESSFEPKKSDADKKIVITRNTKISQLMKMKGEN
jgi:hypothetical protein